MPLIGYYWYYFTTIYVHVYCVKLCPLLQWIRGTAVYQAPLLSCLLVQHTCSWLL
jgi:hypothetical protein